MTEVGGDNPYAYVDSVLQGYRFKIFKEDEPADYDFAVPVKVVGVDSDEIILVRAESAIMRTFDGWFDASTEVNNEHYWYSLPFKASEGLGVDGWIIPGGASQPDTIVLPGTNVRMYPSFDEGDLCFPVDVDGKKILFKFEAKNKSTLWVSGTSNYSNKIGHAVYDTTSSGNSFNITYNMFTPIKKHTLYNGIKQIHPWQNGLTILKEDNTVWRIGPHGYNNQTYSELTAILNEDGSDLIRDAIQVYGCTVLRADGSVWSWINQSVWTAGVNVGKRRNEVTSFPEGQYLKRFDNLPKVSKIFYTELLRPSLGTAANYLSGQEYYRAEDGKILCSGSNVDGQLCVGDYSGPGSHPFDPVGRYGIGFFRDNNTADELIYKGGNVYWLSGGSLYGCGPAQSLTLPGYGWDAVSENPIDNDIVPLAVFIGGGYAGFTASSGSQGLIAWKAAGNADCIGVNSHGQFGGNLLKTVSGPNTGWKTINPYLTMTSIPGLSDVKKIVMENNTTHVITKSGKVYICGYINSTCLVDNIFDRKQGLYEPDNAAEQEGTPYFQQVIDGFPVNSYNRTFLPENNTEPNSGTPIQDRYKVFVYKKPNWVLGDYDYAENELEGKDFQTGTWRLNDIDPITGKLIGEWEWEKKYIEDATELWVQPYTPQVTISAVYIMRLSGRSPNVPDFVEKDIDNFYIEWQAVYNCGTSDWDLSSSRSSETTATGWTATLTGYKKIVENSYFEPDTSELIIPGCYHTWQAVYNCETESYTITRLSSSQEGELSEWSEVSTGIYTRVTDSLTPPIAPTETPTCYYTWQAVYDCADGWTSIYLVKSSFEGEVTEWGTTEYSNTFERVTTSAAQPAPPTETPTCYYTWSATYICFSSEWYLYMTGVSSEGTATEWTPDGFGGYTRTVTTIGEPDPPEGEGTCYYHWVAYTSDYGATWTVDLMFVDEWGFVADWECYNYGGGYCECYATTTSSTPPSPPDFVCE